MKKKAVEFSLKAEKRDFSIEKIAASDDAVAFARKFYHDDILIYESSFIMLLNRANNVIGYAKISQGGLSSAIVDKCLVAKIAIESLASSVILIHNHPSGNARPSNADLQVSRGIKEGLKLFDINLIDSIILTDTDYHSMSDEFTL